MKLIVNYGKPLTKSCESMPDDSLIWGKELEKYDKNLNYTCFEKLCASIITLGAYFS